MTQQTYTPHQLMLLSLRNILVLYWTQLVIQHGHERMMDYYNDYCEALDALDPDNPVCAATLEYATKVLHDTVAYTSKPAPITLKQERLLEAASGC